MFNFLLLTVALLVPILWIWTVLILLNWRYFNPFFLLNAVLIVGYLYAFLTGIVGFFGHNEYGLGRIMAVIILLVSHVVLAFLFAIVRRRSQPGDNCHI